VQDARVPGLRHSILRAPASSMPPPPRDINSIRHTRRRRRQRTVRDASSSLPAPASSRHCSSKKAKGSPYSIAERRVPELIPVLGSQPACDVSHKPGGRLPLLSVRPAVTLATLKRAATNFAAW